MKSFRYLISLIILLTSGFLSAQNAPITTMGTAVSTDTFVIIPVTVVNFTNIGGYLFSITYDTAITRVNNNPYSVVMGSGYSGSINVNLSTPGLINIGWFTFPGVTLPDNHVILNIRFSRKSSGTSPIHFVPGVEGYWDGYYTLLNQMPFSNYYNDGSVTFISDTDAPKTTAPTRTNL